MKRRAFLQKSAAGIVVGATAAAPAILRASPRKLRWRLALAVPKTLPVWGEAMERFARSVELMSEGRLKIKVFGAGELVPAFGTFDAVKSGALQMASSASYYYQGKIPESPFFSSIPFGMNAEGMNAWLVAGGGQELWDELMHPHGVTCLPCGKSGYQTTGWFNKEIKSVEDFKGLKIRIPGLAAKVYAKLGAIPVLLPGGEVFTSLSTGVIDAVEWVGPYHDYIMGFHKAAKYFYFGSWHEPGTNLELMINKKAWDSLDESLKLVIKTAASDTDRWMLSKWSAKNAEYLQKIKKEGKVQIKELPISVLKKLKECSDEILAELANSSKMAKKIFESFKSFQKNYEEYNDLSERAYIKAFKL
ncbi:MAG: TRAP transporter substrate-binding protein [Candidatus Dadabacteria bacterium]|nr:MAG: TRAP transporter substrate-binding protein [Candidatus Dadabacteria bacterium]